jgi:hypothetical protein
MLARISPEGFKLFPDQAGNRDGCLIEKVLFGNRRRLRYRLFFNCLRNPTSGHFQLNKIFGDYDSTLRAFVEFLVLRHFTEWIDPDCPISGYSRNWRFRKSACAWSQVYSRGNPIGRVLADGPTGREGRSGSFSASIMPSIPEGDPFDDLLELLRTCF